VTQRYEISRAAELETLAVFRQFIKQFCQEQGIDDDTCFELTLAVDEACTNVVTHGYAGLNPGSLILALACDGRQVVATLTDFGHPFEPSSAPAPDVTAALEDRPMGGFGLYFIYQTMDQVDYETSPECNVLTFTRRLR
jgi:anti-sigma regulatory factor (Ser/Thr protein kinase)